MPIRMDDDQQDQQEQSNNDDTGGRGGGGGFPGGGGGLISLLPMLVGLFRGKGIIFLLIIGGLLYFLMGRGGCNTGGGSAITDIISQFTKGGELNRDTFDKAKIFEGLDDYKNPLPEAANLQRFAPPVGDQGQQGSCVAWSSGYAARTILEAAKTGEVLIDEVAVFTGATAAITGSALALVLSETDVLDNGEERRAADSIDT